MHLPAYFKETRIDVMHALMRARPLATLVALCDSGMVANHIPVETFAQTAPFGRLSGHVARGNSLWRDYREGTEALAIFQGPQVYISPAFYASKRETGEVVPTWDYAIVHARGTLRFIHDSDWLRGLVGRLTDTQEASRPEPWKVEDAPPAYIEGMLSAIVGFEMDITALTGKWKVSQNHPSANRATVIQALRSAAGADSHEIADMLASRDEPPARQNDVTAPGDDPPAKV